MKFSIITINYNNKDGLQNTINSVLQQCCKDYQYIVIDGGSTDGSAELIEKKSDFIDYWVSEPDNGIYNAMNKGIAQAHGDYCIFMNSGDTFYDSDVLENVTKYDLTEDVVCGNICFGTNNICPNPQKVTLRTLYKHTLYHQASFIKTIQLKAMPYDEKMRSAADWKWFLHALIFKDATYKYVPVTIAFFEGGGISDNSNNIGMYEMAEELKRCFPKRVLEDLEDYSIGTTPYRRMVNNIERNSKLCRSMFFIDKFILKILNVKMKTQWVRNL